MRPDRVLLTRGVLGALFTAFCCAQTAPPPSLYDDSRVREWTRDFFAGHREQVLRSVERDLRSASPDPLAPEMWSYVESSLGRLEATWHNLQDPQLRAALGIRPEVFLLADKGRYDELVAKYPPASADSIRDPTALTRLGWSAYNLNRYADALEYGWRAAHLIPGDFHPVWLLYSIATASRLKRAEVLKRLNADPAFAETADGHFLHAGLDRLPVDDLDLLKAAEAFENAAPADPSVHQLKADKLASLERWDEAIAEYEKAQQRYPFPSLDRWMARFAIALGDQKRAREFAERYARLHVPAADAEFETELTLAQAMMDAGEKGEARTLLEAALKRWPDKAALQGAMARLEIDSNRFDAARIHARRAVEIEPGKMLWRERLIDALRQKKRLPEAVAASEEADRAIPQKTEGFYYESSEALFLLERYDDARQLYERAVREFPDSAWMRSNLAFAIAKTGRPAEALAQLMPAFDNGATAWRIARVREWSVQAEGGEAAGNRKADVETEKLRARLPDSEPLWDDAAGRFAGAGATAGRADVYRRAIAANPGRRWPWHDLLGVYIGAEQWASAAAALREEQQAVDRGGLPSDKSKAAWDRVHLVTALVEKQRVPKAMIEQALRDLEEYKTLGGYLGSYYSLRMNLLDALGRQHEAAEDHEKALALRPDDEDLSWGLVTRRANELGTGRVMRAYEHYVNRSPYDGARLSNMLHLLVMWYSNPAVALQWVKIIKERAPEQLNKSDEALAWGNLGDYGRRYREWYAQSRSISSSDRYIDWYDSACRLAQRERVEVTFDSKDPLIYEVHYATGETVRRKRHPYSGKLMLLQVGKAAETAEYDENGDNLLRVADSAGDWVRLEYYPDSTIRLLVTSDGNEISFAYNENRKPNRIAVKGLGEITVQYGPNGEIQKVDSSDGPAMAVRVTATFQKLLDLTRPFESTSIADVPELPFKDPQAEALTAAFEEKHGGPGGPRAELDLSAYLIAHLGDRRTYADAARQLLDDLLDASEKAGAGRPTRAETLAAVSLWYRLAREVRTNGLSTPDFVYWTKWRAWVTAAASTPGPLQSDAAKLLAEIGQNPLTLLQLANWLPTSYVSSDGFWTRFPFTELLPPDLRAGTHLQAVLVRQNHEVLVGTDRGLIVWSHAHWQWYGFDDIRGRFSPTVALSSLTATSNILSLAERGDRVAVGTARGLLLIQGPYTAAATRMDSLEDGLPDLRIQALAFSGGGLLAGTPKGLRVLKASAMQPAALADDAVVFLRAFDFMGSGGPRAQILAGTASALYVIGDGAPVKVAAGDIKDAVWEPRAGKIFFLGNLGEGLELFESDWNGSAAGAPQRAHGQQNIVKNRDIFGLATIPVEGNATAVAVLTDRGMSLFRDEHFEHQDLPFSHASAGVLAADSVGGRTYALTTEGVYALERGQSMVQPGQVYDLLTDAAAGLTYVARGTELRAVRHSRPDEPPVVFAPIAATRLARDPQGRLIANDGMRIVRFEKNSTEPVELFTMAPTVAEGWDAGHLTSLLCDREGTVWATYGGSVFRWSNGQVQEFSIFKDDTVFPARSEMISRVVETHDHRIWVIASNEEHLFYQGERLSGGILEWTGKGFDRLPMEDTPGWFMTSYTQIGDTRGIVGTNRGFAEHRGDDYSLVAVTNNASYLELCDKQPMLWLGTRGAKLSGDTYLFGTAGGVVGYNISDDHWFLPDALNAKLPDDAKYRGNYGVRTVRAIETDPAGRIYVGTDRGLLIYDSGGTDTSLVTNYFEKEYAFRRAERSKLQQEAKLLLAALPKGSDLAKKVKQYRAAEAEIAKLREKVSPGVVFLPASQVRRTPDPGAPKGGDFVAALSVSEQAQLHLAIEAKEKALLGLLIAMQKENPGLAQLLELKPLDLVALRQQLSPEQAVVQYLPTPKSLYIQVVTHDGSEIRQVTVTDRELQQRALRTARALQTGTGRAFAVEPEPAGPKSDPAELRADLAWLYEQLLRPVENDLIGKKQIFAVPFGNLSYVPLAALIRSEDPKIEYAVERFQFGYLPSMYLFDLMMRDKDRKSTATDALIVGDPDGTLPGAKQEAEEVFEAVGGNLKPLIGAQASYEQFVRYAPNVRLIHMATHGSLTKASPEDSWLLLANRRLSVTDAMMLPLHNTDLVVLSACESGLSAAGMEYVTLSRAFAHAGVAAIVATLWEVPDAASRELVKQFYLHLKTDDRFTALAEAQRDLLRSANPKMREPVNWAGYIPIGRP
jgi:CHAT domain-containing protein/tetratricopeptide (TPR) repeat protein